MRRKLSDTLRRNSYSMRLALLFAGFTVLLMATLSWSSYTLFRRSFNEELTRFHSRKLESMAAELDADVFTLTRKSAITILSLLTDGELGNLRNQPVAANMKTVATVDNALEVQRYALLDFADSISIYYPYNDIIISTRYGIKYLSGVNREGWLKDTEWLQLYRQLGGQGWLPLRTTPDGEMLSYCISVSGATVGTGAILCVNIEVSTLRALLSEKLQESSSLEQLLLTDANGYIAVNTGTDSLVSEELLNELLSDGETTRFFTSDGGETVVSSVKSSATGLYYVYLSDSSEYYSKSTLMKNTLMLLSLALLLIGVVLSVLIVYFYTRPLRSMVKTLPVVSEKEGGRPSKGELSALSDTLNALSGNLRDLDNTLSKNRSLLENTLFTVLLGGGYTNEADLNTKLAAVNRCFDKPCFTVILCRPNTGLTEETAGQTLEYILMKIAESFKHRRDLVCVIPDASSAVLILNHGAAEETERVLSSIRHYLTQELSLPEAVLQIGVSAPHNSLSETAVMYRQTLQLLQYSALYPSCTLFKPSLLANRGLSGAALKKELESILRTSEDTEAETQLAALTEKIREQAFIEDYRELCGMITEQSEAILPLPVFTASVREQRRRLSMSRVPSAALYARRAKEYILENLSKALTIDEVAAYVGISEKYFSRVFHESESITFSDFVTRVRMEQAQKLLDKSDLTPREIADRVGYTDNFTYFSRKFKTLYGVTPSQYRSRTL